MAKIKIKGVEYDYQPYHDEISLEKLKTRLILNPSFRNIFAKNLTDPFMQSMKKIVDSSFQHSQNTIWNGSGETGSGKSTAFISVCKELVPDRFSYRNVVFYDQQILDRVKDIEKDSFVIRDETVNTFGVGSRRISADLQAVGETARKHGLSLIFISPSETEIPIAKFEMQTVDIDYENRITRLAIRDPFTKVFLGALYVKVLPDNDPDILKYEEEKDKFIQATLKGNKAHGKTDYKKLAIDMYKRIDVDLFKTKKERMAYLKNELSNLTNSECEMVATFLEIAIRNQGAWALEDDEKTE